MRTVIVSFSSRTDGNCAKIGKLIKENIKDAIMFSFSEFSIQACGDCNYDCFEDKGKCPHVGDMENEILDSIVHSDITYFVIPNYCDYPCANFFAFNERSQFYFQRDQDLLEAYLKVPKRSIVVSNTNKENFIKVLTYQAEQDPVVLFLSARQYGKKSIQGDLLTNENAVSDILEFINKTFQ